MSVVIKGMKMPKSCKECSLCFDLDAIGWCMVAIEKNKAVIEHKRKTILSEDWKAKRRAEFCPLLEVPQHIEKKIDEWNEPLDITWNTTKRGAE